VKLSFIGHACFLVESDSGTRILLDPYQPNAFGGKIGLRPFLEQVDVVVSTHDHLDHFHMDPAFGSPAVIRDTGTAAGIDFMGIRLPHDAEEGARRGWVTGFRFEVDGISVFHPGDLGRVLRKGEIDRLNPVDVLLVPTGGTFTLGPREAARLVQAIRPAVAVPMHYQWPSVQLPLAPLRDFLAEVPGWQAVPTQPLVLSRTTLPVPTRVMVLDPLS
jgi:L-ascorbate metabolism protein UlaG (beta-lactamase superfamily)